MGWQTTSAVAWFYQPAARVWRDQAHEPQKLRQPHETSGEQASAVEKSIPVTLLDPPSPVVCVPLQAMGAADALKYLLGLPAVDCTATDAQGATAAELAARHNAADLAALLLQARDPVEL